ncbi:MAG: cysteine desulfurase NifS [bacterium]
MARFVYMDHAATTAVRAEVLESMIPYFSARYGNPSSLYSIARETRQAIEKARETVAGILECEPAEIIFTGGGTESDNLAIKGIAHANQKRGQHLMTSQVEHHAVLHTCQSLEKFGFRVTYLPVDKDVVVDIKALEKLLEEQTTLVSIMLANNEVGTIQPVAEISALLRGRRVFFHTDAVQGAGSLNVSVKRLGVDSMSLSSHKFYGPKGVGVLYPKKGVPCLSQMQGGGQERNRRAGTENIAGIVGFARALELAVSEREEQNLKMRGLRDALIRGIMGKIDHVRLTGHPEERLPGHASFCFEFVEGESVLLNLDAQGICVSSGSACTSGSLEPSHVLRAMGIPVEISHGSIRLTLGRDNSMEDVDYLIEVFPPIIEKLRAMSPLAPKSC